MKLAAALAWILLLAAPMLEAQRAVSEDDVFALAGSAQSGERSAIGKLCEFYPLSDGAATEDIDVILGEVTRAHPRVFLEELKAHLNAPSCSNVSNTGEELVDQLSLQLAELELRRDSLQSVSDQSLAAVRDACVAQLNEHIRASREALRAESNPAQGTR
jgi:hypothetical protein